jgi:hypothetical protein
MMELQAIIDSIKDFSLSRGAGRQWDRAAGKPRKAIDPTNRGYRLGGTADEARGMGEETKISVIPSLRTQPRLRATDNFIVSIRQLGPVEFELGEILGVAAGWQHRAGNRALFNCGEQTGRRIVIGCRDGDYVSAPFLGRKFEDDRVIARSWVFTFMVDQPLVKARGKWLVAMV